MHGTSIEILWCTTPMNATTLLVVNIQLLVSVPFSVDIGVCISFNTCVLIVPMCSDGTIAYCMQHDFSVAVNMPRKFRYTNKKKWEVTKQEKGRVQRVQLSKGIDCIIIMLLLGTINPISQHIS